MSWSARLEFAPVVTPDGRKLVTLADARDYLLEHPDEMAAGALLRAAETPNQFYCHCARQAVSRAVHGPEKRPERVKETWREKRKAARHRC
jgi:hypothetical protein